MDDFERLLSGTICLYTYQCMSLAFLRLRPAKTEETTPDAQVGLLSSLLHIGKRSLVDTVMLKPKQVLSFEMVSTEQKSMFYIVVPEELKGYFTSQVLSQYPKTMIVEEKEDPIAPLYQAQVSSWATMRLVHSYVYPIKTFKAEQELPPITALLGFLAKLQPGEGSCIQLLVRVVNSDRKQANVRGNLKHTNAEGEEEANPYQHVIQQKLSTPILEVQLKIGMAAQNQQIAQAKLQELSGSFGVYTLSEGNAMVSKKVSGLRQKSYMSSVMNRSFTGFSPRMMLNLEEIASLWHLPDSKFDKVKLIDWGKTVISEAPDNLAVAEIMTDDKEKREINFFGKTEWRNHEAIFGIKRPDRRRHIYIIGKTGAGKSTLIANMAINDIRNGEGVAVVDPHGDLCEMILKYVPKRRLNDVVYLDPTLTEERSFSLNLFDDDGVTHMDVVASGIVSVLYKLYHNSWGPRLEYILRNSILSLLYYREATFADIPKILTDTKFRQKVVEKISTIDPVIADFWKNEFDKMSERMRIESISPILNKVGQFLSSKRIRHIVGERQSTFSLEEVMNDKKILLVNLSQGKLGEDTTALLGALLITKIQLTAMKRVHVSEDKRQDFYLYVDEFQNFATTTFVNILSEARKYRLDLIMANQYIEQVDEEVQHAIFGNVGSLVSFVVGANDATHIEREFGGVFEAPDLVGLGKYEILMKLAIDGLTSEPFMAKTLPLPSVVNDNAEKIIRVSTERYYRKVSG